MARHIQLTLYILCSLGLFHGYSYSIDDHGTVHGVRHKAGEVVTAFKQSLSNAKAYVGKKLMGQKSAEELAKEAKKNQGITQKFSTWITAHKKEVIACTLVALSSIVVSYVLKKGYIQRCFAGMKAYGSHIKARFLKKSDYKKA